MPGLDDPRTIDLIGEEPTGEISLIIAHNRGWTDAPDELTALADKINNYAVFALDGGLTSNFPDYAGRPTRILIDCTAEPTPKTADLLDQLKTRLAPYSLGLVVKINR